MSLYSLMNCLLLNFVVTTMIGRWNESEGWQRWIISLCCYACCTRCFTEMQGFLFFFFKLLIVITMDCLFWDIISLVKFPCKPSSFVYMHSYVTIWICSLINVVIFRNLESLPFILNSVLLEGTRLRRQDLVLNLLSGPLPVQAWKLVA